MFTYENLHPIIVVVGPTASGKSHVAIELANRFNGEIISVDSLQLYKDFNIGTGKISFHEKQTIPHHLLDNLSVESHFNAAMFRKNADIIVKDIVKRGKVVIAAGGTGLYLKALLHGLFDTPSLPSVRKRLQLEYQTKGSFFLYQRLREIDPDSTKKIAQQDSIRIIRALEVFEITKIPFSTWIKEHQHKDRRYPAFLIGINPPRDKLYAQINDRVKNMLEQGWSQEIEMLKLKGYSSFSKPMQCIGYKEINLFFEGKIEPNELYLKICQQTRLYAKRQLTWFRKEPVFWYSSPEELINDSNLMQRLGYFIKNPIETLEAFEVDPVLSK